MDRAMGFMYFMEFKWDGMGWVDHTPMTVTTTRAPAVLKTEKWKKMEQLSKQLYDTLWQIENSIKSWKDDQIARHEYVYNSLFFPLFSNLEYVTKCIKESANLVQNQSQVGIGFVVQLCSTVPILYFFSSRAVWAMSNNPTNFAQAGGIS